MQEDFDPGNASHQVPPGLPGMPHSCLAPATSISTSTNKLLRDPNA